MVKSQGAKDRGETIMLGPTSKICKHAGFVGLDAFALSVPCKACLCFVSHSCFLSQFVVPLDLYVYVII